MLIETLEKVGDLKVIILKGIVQREKTRIIHCLHPRPDSHQELHQRKISPSASLVQRRDTSIVHDINIRSVLDENLRHGHTTGMMQERLSLAAVSHVDDILAMLLDKFPQSGGLTPIGGLVGVLSSKLRTMLDPLHI